MDNRFSNMFGLSEEECIRWLDTPMEDLKDEPGNPRYAAATHLANYSSDASIQALIRAIHNTNPELDNRIVRRKAVETLGRLKSVQALPIVRSCLADEDCYTVENAVWSIGEIGTDNADILEEVSLLLEKPKQTYRVIIHVLAKLGYKPGVARIQKFTDHEDRSIASAALTSIARLTDDRSELDKVVEFLQDANVYARRLSIQDLVDAEHYAAIPAIAQSPVSVSFRLRGIRLLADAGVKAGKLDFAKDVEPWLDKVIGDDPKDIVMVHEYDQAPTLEFLLSELYQTDFGRCYLALQTLMADHREGLAPVVMATYMDKARNDYGGHYLVMKLLGWLQYEPALELIIKEGLHNPMPQFQKSQFAAALALGDLGTPDAIAALKEGLKSPVWMVKYATLMALEKVGDRTSHAALRDDPDWLIRAKLDRLLETASSAPTDDSTTKVASA